MAAGWRGMIAGACGWAPAAAAAAPGSGHLVACFANWGSGRMRKLLAGVRASALEQLAVAVWWMQMA
jgi:hypothetical protein